MRVARTAGLFLLVSLLACQTSSENLDQGPWPEPLEAGSVLTWEVTFPGGHETFALDRDGAVRYENQQGRRIREERRMSREDMLALRNDLRDAGCCHYQGPWQADAEFMASLRIRMPNLQCDVVMPTLLLEVDPHAFNRCNLRLAEEWIPDRPRVIDTVLPWDLYLGPEEDAAWESPHAAFPER